MGALKVQVEGCDDTNTVVFEGTEEELETILKLARLVNENSTYSCEPSMTIYRDGDCIETVEVRD